MNNQSPGVPRSSYEKCLDLLYPGLASDFSEEEQKVHNWFKNSLTSCVPRATLRKMITALQAGAIEEENFVEIKSELGTPDRSEVLRTTDPEPSQNSKSDQMPTMEKISNSPEKSIVIIESPKRQVRRSKRVAEHKPKEQPTVKISKKTQVNKKKKTKVEKITFDIRKIVNDKTDDENQEPLYKCRFKGFDSNQDLWLERGQMKGTEREKEMLILEYRAAKRKRQVQ